MTMTNPPPVAPVEGHYALLRNGMVVGPLAKEWPQDELTSFSIAWEHLEWKQDGTGHGMLPAWDIIATISPADMQAVANGELERLKEALELAIAANTKMKNALSFYADDGPTPNVDGPWKATSWDFGTVARCALADVANIEGGKNP